MPLERYLVETASEADPERRLTRVLAAALEGTGAAEAALVRFGDDAAGPTTVARVGAPAASLGGGDEAAIHRFARRVADARAVLHDSAAGHARCGAPIVGEGGAVGALVVDRAGPRPFSDEGGERLELLVALAGGALRELALLEQVAPEPERPAGAPGASRTGASADDGAGPAVDLVDALGCPRSPEAIFEGIHDGVLLFDADDRLVLWNQRVASFSPIFATGIRAGLPFADLVRACAELGYYRGLGGTVDEIVAQRTSPDFPIDVPCELQVPDPEVGDERVISVKEIRTLDGGRVLVLTDVTDLRRAGAALQASEQSYRLLVDGVDDIIYRISADGHFTYVNQRVASIVGWTADQLIGTHYLDLIVPEHRPSASRFYVRQFARRIPTTYYEFPTLAADGRTVWVGQRVRLLEADGRNIGAIAVARDITARKQAEADEHDRLGIVEAIATGAALDETLGQLVALFRHRAPAWRPGIFVGRSAAGEVSAAPDWPAPVRDTLTACLTDAEIAPQDPLSGREAAQECLSRALGSAGLESWTATCHLIRGADNAVVGLWAMIAEGSPALSADAQRALAELVHLAAVAIERARLTERLEIRAARARTLNRLSQLVSSSLDLETVLAEITRAAGTLVGAPVARFWTVDEAANEVWLAAEASAIANLDTGPRRLPISALRGIISDVIRTREAIAIPDATGDPRIANAALWSAHNLRSFLGEPVLHNGRLLAVLVFWGYEPFRLDADDDALLDSFMAHAAVSIHNAQLFRATDQQRRHLQSQVELSHRLSRGLDVAEVLDAVAEAAAATFGGDASVRLLDGEQLVRASVSRGARHRPTVERISRHDPLVGQIFATGRPLATPDVTADERVPAEYRELLRRVQKTALLVAPIRHGDEILGTLHIYRERGHAWEQANLDLAATLAEEAGAALINASRYASLQESLERAKIPVRVNQLLSEALDLEVILREIAAAAVRITGAVVASVWLNDEQSRTLTLVTFSDPSVGARQTFRKTEHGHGAAGWVAQHRMPLHVDDIFADGRSAGLDWWRLHNLRSSYTAPIVDGASIVGVLSINGREPIVIGDETRELLAGLLSQSATAIRNAALYREVSVANRRLEQEVRRTELLLNSVADGIFGVDDRGRMTFVNPAATRMLGHASVDLIGKDAHDLLHRPPSTAGAPAGGPCQDGTCPAAIALRQAREFRSSDDVLWHHDGRPLPVDIVITPLQQDGESIGAVVTFRDLTRQLEAERQRQALAQSEKLRALGQLASGVAHDLNQSLGLVVGHSELALDTIERGDEGTDDEPDAATLRESLETIMQGALDGAETVKRLQTFVRGQADGDPERVAVPALLTDVVRLTAPRWRDAAQAVGAPIDFAVNASLSGDDEIVGWPASLREALTNLVFNAVDAMPRSGRLELVGRSGRRDNMIVIEVVDSGSGMTPEVAARVFEPFFTTKGDRGTGLGLAMVYGIVERHGGQIEIDSTPGVGTTVRLHLPRPPRVAAPQAVERMQETVSSRSILIVDDEAALRRMMTQMLQIDGHRVVAAATAAEAVAMLEEQRFDVVLSDHGLGLGMNGLELATLVRDRWPGTRFILVTGWGGSIDPSEVAALGVESVISKPYRAPELRQRINALS